MGAEPAYIRHYDEEDPDDIREEIERTRAHMTQTVDRIQERLAPDHIKQQAQDALYDATLGKVENMAHSAQSTATGWTNNLVHTIRENPVPAALTGIGLAWLLASSNSSSARTSSDYYYTPPAGYRAGNQRNTQRYYSAADPYSHDAARRRDWERQQQTGLTDEARARYEQTQARAQQALERTQEQARDVADQVQEHVHQAQENVQEWTHQAQYQVQQQAHHAQEGFYRQVEQNPLMVGAIALGVGALIGMSLPSTPVENRYLGETRDHVMHQVQETAQDAVQHAKEIAVEAKDAAVETAKEEADRMSFQETDSRQEAAHKAQHIAEKAKDAAAAKAREEAEKRDMKPNNG